jgi:hypothetical protein
MHSTKVKIIAREVFEIYPTEYLIGRRVSVGGLLLLTKKLEQQDSWG